MELLAEYPVFYSSKAILVALGEKPTRKNIVDTRTVCLTLVNRGQLETYDLIHFSAHPDAGTWKPNPYDVARRNEKSDTTVTKPHRFGKNKSS